jgi:hypothetical protein
MALWASASLSIPLVLPDAMAAVQGAHPEDQRAPDVDAAQLHSYRLDAPTYAALVSDDRFDDNGEHFNAVTPTRRWPTQPQLVAMLRPMVDVDFPTHDLFVAALKAGRCGVLSQLMQMRPTPRGGAAVAAGPDPCAPGPGPLGDENVSVLDQLPAPLTAEHAYQQLLPAAVRNLIVTSARQLHSTPPLRPTLWLPTDACQCAPSPPKSELYAWATPWGSTAQQQAVADGPPHAGLVPPPPWQRVLDFGVYTRVNWFGAVLGGNTSTAELLMPDTLTAQRTQLAQLTRQYSGGIDLVVYRRDWQALLSRSAADLALYQTSAAQQIIKQLDAPMPLPRWHRLLLPFLREPARAFDGVTLFFDQTPRAGDQYFDAYDAFFEGFVKALTKALQASGHPYRLNFVLPADDMGETGVYNFRRLMGFIAAAERPRPGTDGPTAPSGDGLAAAPGLQRTSSSKQVDLEPLTPLVGTTDIEVYVIPLLSAPTTTSKKQLRERIDRSEKVKGPDRVYLLRSLVPMLLRPGSERLADAQQSLLRQFDDDLAYMKWNFGGTSLWETPTDPADPIDAELITKLGNRYGASGPGPARWCPWVCPHRMGWRLALQTLVAMGMVAAGAWWWRGFLRRPPRGAPRWFRICLWACGLTVMLVAAALVTCDPGLASVRAHSTLLFALFALTAVYGGFRLVRTSKRWS